MLFIKWPIYSHMEELDVDHIDFGSPVMRDINSTEGKQDRNPSTGEYFVPDFWSHTCLALLRPG